MVDNNFFNEQSELSQAKAIIVSKYFFAWAKVIIATQKKFSNIDRIAYIDLFAGPGRYEDGSQSTPLMILENACNDENISNRLVTIFNDKDENNTQSLQAHINQIENIACLKYEPQIKNHEVGEEIVKMFEQMNLVPTLFFVDPWGYKGLSLRLVNSVLKNWGCDCIFFFNYNRINMGLSNDLVKEHMNALFGKERADTLRFKLDPLPSEEREQIIIEELCQALKEYGNRFTLPFAFKNSSGKRSTHHLIFVSKDFRGYDIMKEIMAKESTDHIQGVPSFTYNPADFLPKQSLLFQLSRPLDELKNMLLNDFKGQTLKMIEIYEQHSIDTPYTKKNYKSVLMQLEDEKLILASKHRKNTFGDKVTVTFPN